MIWMYLNKDITGTMSLREYGKAGCKVHIIKNNDPLLLVEDEDGNKFFVKKTDLSNEPVQTIQAKTLAKKTRR